MKIVIYLNDKILCKSDGTPSVYKLKDIKEMYNLPRWWNYDKCAEALFYWSTMHSIEIDKYNEYLEI